MLKRERGNEKKLHILTSFPVENNFQGYAQVTGNHNQSNCLRYNLEISCEANHVKFYLLLGYECSN